MRIALIFLGAILFPSLVAEAGMAVRTAGDQAGAGVLHGVPILAAENLFTADVAVTVLRREHRRVVVLAVFFLDLDGLDEFKRIIIVH